MIIEAAWVICPGMVLKKETSVVCDAEMIAILPWKEARKRFPGVKILQRHDCVHMHAYGVLAHGSEPPVPVISFKSFLEDYWWPLVENLLDPHMIAAAAAYTSYELADSGVTAFCDVLEAPNAGLEGLKAEAEVVDSLGLRAVLSTEACERSGLEKSLELLQANVEFIEDFSSHDVISGMICTHTAFTCSAEYMKAAKRKAEELSVSLQFHLNESSYEPDWCMQKYGQPTCSWYAELGILDSGILAAQGVQLTTAEIQQLAASRVRLVHVPLSNCEVGGGISPVPELLKSGISCGLGTDGYINNFFEVMRAAFLIHKGHRCDPTVMDARTVFEMATEMGADVVFPGKNYGRIMEGVPADLITISIADLPTPVTTSNLFDQLILFRNPSAVCDVFVGGRLVKNSFEMITADFSALQSEVKKEAERLWQAGKKAANTVEAQNMSL